MGEELESGPGDIPSGPHLAVPVSSINVLVVDDNEANRFAFRTLLEPLGHSVFLASSGREALILAAQYRFAVILLDVRMPMMDGLETATLLRRKPFSARTPILFVSAHQTTVTEVSQLAIEGPIGYVHSPVDSELLVWKVRQYVALHITNERIRLRSEIVWQSQEEHLVHLKASGAMHSGLRRSGLRLAAAIADLREALSERQGVSPD